MIDPSPFPSLSQQCQSPFVAKYHRCEPRSTLIFTFLSRHEIVGSMAELQAYDISDERIDLGSGVSLPRSWHARVSGEQDVPGTITVRVEWDAALGRSAVAFAALEREGGGVDITSQVLREVRTHWIMTNSALDVVTVDVGESQPIGGTRVFLGRQLARVEREQTDSILDAVAIYRVATALSYPPLKLVSDTLKISQSTATRIMSRARDSGLAPEVRIQEPRRAPAVDRYFPGTGPYDPSQPHRGPANPGGRRSADDSGDSPQ